MSRGWVVTLSGLGINLALGILYTWSVIKGAIPNEWGWTDFQKALPYSIACVWFSFMMVPAGRMQDRISPRLVATLGGLMVGAGMILASQSNSCWNYVLGFGLLAGTGIGFGYASATPPAVKWFPAKRTGLIAGLVVSGFGLASVYAAPLSKWLTGAYGVPSTMWILGIAFLIVVVGLAQFLKVPPKGYVPGVSATPVTPATGASATPAGAAAAPAAPPANNFAPLEMMGTRQFYLLWFMYACGAGAGLMIIANWAVIVEKYCGIPKGFIFVASLAVGNGGGRILAGSLSDRIGRKATIMGCLLFQALLMVVLTFAGQGSALANLPVLVVLSALIGANYGANLALYPSITKDFYGLKNFGVNYGLVFTAWGIGGLVLPLMAGKFYDWYQIAGYVRAWYLTAGMLVVAAVVALLLQSPARKTA